ncbi:MAG TPA: single-stranded-DNA-specific exonuclease RecJ, partial [Candidatus Berkiella sp.]|nr:single-stranded-DNA-specific exonuclease RecJ [Candidatus Berkiella sp.]
QSAYAVVSPTRTDSQYPDRLIAGCMVAWLLMAAVRSNIVQNTSKILPSLAECLDFVAVGTIADCVSIARSKNNRAIVSYGMKL